jgi:hypothetical protein
MPENPRPHLPISIVVVNAAYLLGATGGAVVTGNQEFVFYILVMLVILAGLLALHRHRPLSLPLMWCFSLWGGLHMAGGLLNVPATWPTDGKPVLYNLWLAPYFLKFDQAVHAYGFGITTWLTWHLLRLTVRSTNGTPLRPTPGILLLCTASGMGFGALNEVVEFIATQTLPNTNVGGYVNTGWDLVANLIGGVLTSAILYFVYRKEAMPPGIGTK